MTGNLASADIFYDLPPIYRPVITNRAECEREILRLQRPLGIYRKHLKYIDIESDPHLCAADHYKKLCHRIAQNICI